MKIPRFPIIAGVSAAVFIMSGIVLDFSVSTKAIGADTQQSPSEDVLQYAKLPAWPPGLKSMVPPVKGKTWQADPGTKGNGSIYLPPPYKPLEEANVLFGKAVAGKLSAEKVFFSKKCYSGLYFRYCVYVPAQYQKGKPAALMVMLDDRMYWDPKVSEFHAPTVFDNLIVAGEAPVTIILFIAPGTTDPTGNTRDAKLRSEEYDTVSNRYGTFLLDELIPEAVTNDYDIVDDPNGWAIGGHGSGGLAAFTAGWFFPEKFRKIQTNSGAFLNLAISRGGHNVGGASYPGLVRNTEQVKPLRIALQTGSHDDRTVESGDIAVSNFAMAEAFAAKGYPFRFCWGEGYHYRHDPPLGQNFGPDEGAADFPAEMRWLWSGYKLPYYR